MLIYSQVRLLAEAILAMLAQVKVKELVDSEHGHLAGGMRITTFLPEHKISDNMEGEQTICQQPTISVPMETVSLSKIA